MAGARKDGIPMVKRNPEGKACWRSHVSAKPVYSKEGVPEPKPYRPEEFRNKKSLKEFFGKDYVGDDEK